MNKSSLTIYRPLILFAVISFAALIIVKPAKGADVETSLLKFTYNANGFFPYSALVTDGTNLYGTTLANLPNDLGVVFELSPPSSGHGPWTETVLYAFTGGSAGFNPYAGLVRDASGNLYGTTSTGGDRNSNCSGGCGAVFELSPPSQAGGSWTETTLYQFQGGSDGADPETSLILDAAGNLYGTTLNAGDVYGACCSTAFKLSPPATPGAAWTETVLHDFAGGDDGEEPFASLRFGANGELLGTTVFGGGAQNSGTVFQLTPQPTGEWSEKILYSFSGGADGGGPESEVVINDGVIYGTTVGGGLGVGTVFQLKSVNGVMTETVLYPFEGGSDGAYPYSGVIRDDSGNLYGTAYRGGDNSLCQGNGCGVIYELSQSDGSWSESVLHTFDGSDGIEPYARLLYSHDALWGTTINGGKLTCKQGCGVVFRLGL
jgi:hypothetical protein